MHLKSLTLKGFKSFAAVTTLKFEPGICCVVGPNGSGKSNVVDALTWVMGEQGAKALRGGKMEDVIFAGAGDRKPLGRAEVTLTIDNSDGALPVEYSEVSITRRMFRDGASDYEINGAKVRLMDVQELLSDSGIGREMHVIVGQGRLSEILQSRPEERRAYIEEAAGVLKHRRRKEKAQRKLIGMQANLDRLMDLTGELKKQLKPLARQAAAAQRAQGMQAQLREARLTLAADDLAQLIRVAAAAEARAEELAAQMQAAETQLIAAESLYSSLEEARDAVIPEANAARDMWFQLSALAEKVSATRSIAADRMQLVLDDTPYSGQDPLALEEAAAKADGEFKDLSGAVDDATDRLATIRDIVAGITDRVKASEAELSARMRAVADQREGLARLVAAENSERTQIEATQTHIEEATVLAKEVQQRLQAARVEAAELDEKLTELDMQREPLERNVREAQAESERLDERLKELRTKERDCEKRVATLESRIETLQCTRPRPAAAATLGESFQALSAMIRPKPGLEKAVAAALGDFGAALAGQIKGTVIDSLKEASVARTVLIDTTDAQGKDQKTWRMDAVLPAGCSWLLDLVELHPSIAGPVTRVLANFVFASDDTSARTVVSDDPRLVAVTEDGTLCGDGWVELGDGVGTSPVETEALIERAACELNDAEKQLAEMSGTVAGATSAADAAKVAVASTRAALKDLDGKIDQVGRDQRRVTAAVTAARGEYDRARARQEQVEKKLAELEKTHAATVDRLERAEDPDSLSEPDTADRDAVQEELRQATAMEVEARLALRTAEERADALRGRGESLRRRAAAERQARAQHEARSAARRAKVKLAETVAHLAAELTDRVSQAVTDAAQQRDAVEEKQKSITDELAKARTKLTHARSAVDQLVKQVHTTDVEVSRAQVHLDEMIERVKTQLSLEPETLLSDYTIGEDFDREEEEHKLREAEAALSSLGKVNPLALEEYSALEERYNYLAGQLADVEKARKDLTDVIDDVDRMILELFTNAWHDVEKEFPAVFATLFPGGTGKLILTDPQNMLTTGIEVEARPPGKKVTRLSLLSGGEKSLTALAMLVAIFKARPSPFYVLDEVEAALDDVNLRRLIALLEELRHDSQLIVITHQKPTMDVANVLYGVTMRGDGVTRVISQRMSPLVAGNKTDVDNN